MLKPFVDKKNSSDFASKRDFVHRIFINDQIKAPSIMVVDSEWKNLWTFTRNRALELAEQSGLDLVQLNYDPVSKVCTAKIVDYGKYAYQKQRDDKEKNKKQKKKVLKEIKLTYMIWQNDLDLKVKKAEEFLSSWYNVKISIRLRGRERMYSDWAKQKLIAVMQQLEKFGKSQFSTPKQEAQWYSVTLFAKAR